MKKVIILALFIFYGCATPGPKKFELPIIAAENTANIGDKFFEYTKVTTGFFGEIISIDFKIELIVVEANSNKIGFFYSEYTGSGLIREGFNMRLDHSGNDKIIRFREYEFEIISINNGQIKYKRIK